MKIKTFNASAMSEAIAEIKRELGEEALILSTKEVEIHREPGKAPVLGVEVVAAGNPVQEVSANVSPIPVALKEGQRLVSSPAALAARRAYQGISASMTAVEDLSPFPKPTAANPPAPPLFSSPAVAITPRMAFARRQESSTFSAAKRPVRNSPPEPAVPPKEKSREKTNSMSAGSPVGKTSVAEKTPQTISREMVELKRLIRWSAQSVVSSRSQFSDSDADGLFVDLVANDMDESIARKILMEACTRSAKDGKKKNLDAYARGVFRDWVQVSALNEKSQKRIVSIFVGPTGVGKTTTIAKLASRFALELGKKTLLITLDTYRIGAAEQLRIYADLIGIPLLVVNSIPDLDQQLQKQTEAEVILIDTVGRAHSRLHQLQEPADYVRGKEWIEKHLVLSLATKPLDLREITDAYELFFGIDKLLFTKLDETLTSGAAANELVRTQKPLSYMTNGQNVPQDIQIPTPASFAEFIVGRDYGEDVRMAYA